MKKGGREMVLKRRWIRWTIGLIVAVSVLTLGIQRLTADPNHRAVTLAGASLAVSPDRTVLATIQEEALVLWRVPELTVMRRLRHDALVRPRNITWRPDGQALAVQNGVADDTVVIYHLADDTVSTVTQGRTLVVLSLAWSPDMQWLAIGTQAQIDLIHMPDGRLTHTLAQRPPRLNSGLFNGPESLLFDPTGEMLLSGNPDGTVHRWRVQDGSLLSRMQAHSDRVTSMAISPDGQTLATGSTDTTIGLWNLDDGTARATLRGHAEAVTSVAWSPDSQLIASGSGNGGERYFEDLRHVDTTVRVWRVHDGQVQFTFQGHPRPILGVAFVGDGTWLISGAWPDGLRRWKVR